MKKKYPNYLWSSAGDQKFKLKSLTVLHLLSIRAWLDRDGDHISGHYDLAGAEYYKDGRTIPEWKEIIDGEIARRVMLKVDGTDSMMF